MRLRSRSTSRCRALVSMVSGRPSRRRAKWRSLARASSSRSRSFSATSSRATLGSRETKTASARRIWSAIIAWKPRMSCQPASEKRTPCFCLRAASRSRPRSMMSPMCSRLVVKVTASRTWRALVGGEAALHQLGEVELDPLLLDVDLASPSPRRRGCGAGRSPRRSGSSRAASARPCRRGAASPGSRRSAPAAGCRGGRDRAGRDGRRATARRRGARARAAPRRGRRAAGRRPRGRG